MTMSSSQSRCSSDLRSWSMRIRASRSSSRSSNCSPPRLRTANLLSPDSQDSRVANWCCTAQCSAFSLPVALFSAASRALGGRACSWSSDSQSLVYGWWAIDCTRRSRSGRYLMMLLESDVMLKIVKRKLSISEEFWWKILTSFIIFC